MKYRSFRAISIPSDWSAKQASAVIEFLEYASNAIFEIYEDEIWDKSESHGNKKKNGRQKKILIRNTEAPQRITAVESGDDPLPF